MTKHTDPTRGCPEYQSLSRRRFLGGTGLAAAAGASLPALAPRIAFGKPGAPARDVLVHTFLRGAADGLSIVVPYGDPYLYTSRPTLAVPPPGQPNGALDLDGFFGLNPNAAGLLSAYNNGHLAFVQAAGSTDPTRSHFDAELAMEGGVPNGNLTQVKDGWLGRHVRETLPWGAGDLRGLALEPRMPIYMVGSDYGLPIEDPPSFEFPGRASTSAARRAVLEAMYAQADEPLRSGATSTFGSYDLLASVDFENYTSSGGVPYPNSYFGNQLRMTAAMLKADIGIEAFGVDYNGWDHHENMGPLNGLLAFMLADLSASLEAFYLDLAADGWLDSTVILVMSEFGRTVLENVSQGTDHGRGNMMLAIGGHIAGGQVLGTWPGLAPHQLELGDLAITTDYRDVTGEILVQRMGSTDLGPIFPGHTPNFPGITT